MNLKINIDEDKHLVYLEWGNHKVTSGSILEGIISIDKRLASKSCKERVRSAEKDMIDVMADGKEVVIYHNKDTGGPLFSIVLKNNSMFWLDSFESVEEAQKYVREHGLVVAGESCGIDGCTHKHCEE